MYSRHDAGKVLILDATINGKDAIRGGAPLEVVLVVDVGTGEELLISVRLCQWCSMCYK